MTRRMQYLFRRLLATAALIAIVLSLPTCVQPEQPVEEPPAAGQPTEERPAEFEVGSLTFTPSTILSDDSATVTASVTNTGGITGTYTAVLTVDGHEAGRNDLSLEPGRSKEVSFQVTTTSAGDYELAIGESRAVMTVYDWCPYTIQYDKGKSVGLWSIYLAGEFGHIVHFTPPAKPFKIRRIKVEGYAEVEDFADWDERDFTVRIWDDGKTRQLWSQDFPWRLFMGFKGSIEIPVPDIRVDDDFHVEVVTHSDEPPAKNFIGLYYEESEGETRSGASYLGSPAPLKARFQSINWFIRVQGEGAPF